MHSDDALQQHPCAVGWRPSAQRDKPKSADAWSWRLLSVGKFPSLSGSSSGRSATGSVDTVGELVGELVGALIGELVVGGGGGGAVGTEVGLGGGGACTRI